MLRCPRQGSTFGAVLQEQNEVGVLFAEIATPGVLNGFDLARMAQAHNPQIDVIMVAGASPSGFSGAAPEVRFVAKSYRMTDVIRLIRKLTESSSRLG